MEFGGRYLLGAPRMRVWDGLNDAGVLGRTIPGCTHIAWTGATTLDLVLSVNLGVAQPAFTGELELSDIEPARRYTLSGRGKGGLLGRVHGSAEVILEDASMSTGTLLAFRADGGASKRLLQLGRPLIGRSAQGVIDGFFMRFAKALDVSIEPQDLLQGKG